MRITLAKTTVVVAALVAATAAGISTHSPRAAAAGGGAAWPIDTYGIPQSKDNVVLLWDEQLLKTIRAYPGQTGPTVTARALAEVHTAMYDAWAAYDQTAVGATPGAPTLPANGTAADRDQAMSYAAYRTLADLFPWDSTATPGRPKYFPNSGAYTTPDNLLGTTQKYDPTYTSTDLGTPAGVGNAAAAAVIAYRQVDGSNQLGGYANTTNYVSKNKWNVVNDKWSWQPLCVMSGPAAARTTPPDPFPTECSGDFAEQKPLTPQWGTIKTFGPASDPAAADKVCDKSKPGVNCYPPQFSLPGPNADRTHTQANTDIANELTLTSNLTDTQKMKAEYWADGPNSEFPPGHMADFAQAFSRMKGDTADQDVKLFFALGNALFDASIFSWTSKFQYDSERPTTGIRERYRGQLITSWLGPKKGYGKVPGERWLPYQSLNVVTPGFPEYVSGHSTFSAAGRAIINRFFGTDTFNAKVTIPAGSSKIEPGLTPAKTLTFTWKTLDNMADDAGMSRRYGGIHFQSGDEQGRTLGALTGVNVWTQAQRYFAPTP
ncbi:MAG TPA: hypothetical protein VI357_04055 [Mycobacteriales bacterium]